ncbi:MAG: ABC transporter ATP-binding protein, partial [Firmicutes bacterium]|nr:ABC transporter ATP-binding protein [Bacillota bacterium]
NLTGMRIIQAFHQEKKQAAALDNLNSAYQNASIREFRWDVLFNRSFDLLGNLAVALMVWAGGLAVFHHRIQIGVLYAFISYIQQLFEPINTLTQNWNTLQSSLISAERVSGVLAEKTLLTDPSEPVLSAAAQIAGRIEFDRVTFAYAPDQPILQGITLTVQPGQFIGIAGETGAGKSTLIGLLARFYDVTGGAIRIDGVDIRQVRQEDLHRWIAVVQQEVNLYSGTIADNIRLFRPQITDTAIEQAAQLTGADSFIRQLPQGYRTVLTPHGSNLSAGQRQLLAFARTVVLNPKILVLDEATANLDVMSEMVVQRGLMELAKHRTTLVIAHRLSTIREADRIYVLSHGRIVEAGTHEELQHLGGYYAEMLQKSSGKRANSAGD